MALRAPSHSCTCFTLRPASKSREAQVCRKLWKVAQASPTLSRVGLRTGARGSIDM